jgi:hypothetical protein
MAAPFLNAIGSTTSGAPGTGAFTPNAAAPGLISWADSIWGAPTGWIGLVRYDDGSAWELYYGYWNGTTISRTANSFVTSSTGSVLSLTSAAVATMVANGAFVQPNLGMGLTRGNIAIPNATTSPAGIGSGNLTVTGTAGTATVATTNFLTERGLSQTASATTANAQAGYTQASNMAVNNTTAGRGGWEFMARFATPSAIPVGRRLFVGATSISYIGSTIDPSPGATAAHLAGFALDGADTNIQLLTNDGTASNGTKIDTGIPFVQNGYYHAQIWMRPGGGRVYALLIRLDTGDIWFGTTATDIPGTATLRGQCLGWLGATAGVAFTMNLGALTLRSGGV